MSTDGFLGIGANVVNTALGGINYRKREKRAMDNQIKLMGIQQANQEYLSKLGYKQSLDLWKATNYPAQLAMMKEAGLSPGLMYKQGGAGGTTSVSSGGSASGGSAPMPNEGRGMDIASILNAQLLKAQKENIEADTRKKHVEAENTEGVVREETQKRIENLSQGISNLRVQGRLLSLQADFQDIQNDIAESTKGYRISYVGQELLKMQGEAISALSQGNVDQATIQEKIKILQGEAIGVFIDNALKKANIGKTEAEIEKISEDIKGLWSRIYNERLGVMYQGQSVNNQEKANAIRQFEAEIKANYPNIWNTFGKGINDLSRWLGQLIEGTWLDDKPIKMD